jgi:hypothetical protein
MKKKKQTKYGKKRLNNIYINTQSTFSLSSKSDESERTSIGELAGGAHTNLLQCFTLEDETHSNFEEKQKFIEKNGF